MNQRQGLLRNTRMIQFSYLERKIGKKRNLKEKSPMPKAGQTGEEDQCETFSGSEF